MANTKNNPDNKSTEQRGKDTSLGNTPGRANMSNQPGDRSTTDEARTAGQPGTQRKGAETIQGGASDRNTAGVGKPGNVGDRTDREVAGSRTTGQNPTGARNTNDGELRDEEDADALPTSEELDADADNEEDTDDLSAADEATTKVK